MKNVFRSIATAAVGAGAVFFLTAAGGVSGDEAKQLVQRGAVLLDVRTPQEFAAGHIDGARNIPVQELEQKLSALPAQKSAPIVVYCRSGARSAKAASVLRNAGYTEVHDLGAMSNWK